MSIDGTMLAQQVGHFDFPLGRRAEGEAVDHSGLHGGDHLRVGVAEDHRAPGADVVGVPLAVGVLHLGARALLEEERRAADRAEGADRRIDAAGDVLLGACEELLRCVEVMRRGSLEKALILGGAGGDVRRAEKVGNDGEQIGAGSDAAAARCPP